MVDSPFSWLSSSKLSYSSDMVWIAVYTQYRSETNLSAKLSLVPLKPRRRATDWPTSSLQIPGTEDSVELERVEGGVATPINPGTDTMITWGVKR